MSGSIQEENREPTRPTNESASVLEPDNKSKVYRAFRAYRTSSEMITDRGYTLPLRVAKIKDFGQFVEKFARSGTTSAASSVPEGREEIDYAVLNYSAKRRWDNATVQVRFRDSGTTINVATLRKYVTSMINGQISSIVLIGGDLSSLSAQLLLDQTNRSTQYRIETFSELSMQVNPTHHCLVPKHILLSESDKQHLLARYRMREEQLPKIYVHTDPIARYLGLRRGDLIKVVRRSELDGCSLYYRLGC